MLYSIIFGDNTIQDKFILIVSYLTAIFFAIVLHEISHGFVAHLNGDDTAKFNGRLSLNPMRHFEPLGMVMFVLVGIGWARPVPINSNNFKNRKVGLVTVSIAGVAMNLILSFINFGIYVGMGALMNRVAIDSVVLAAIVKLIYSLGYFGTFINISLIAFNLLPLCPLDGFRLVEVFTKPNNKYVTFMRKYSMFIFIALILLGVLADFTGWPCDVLGMYISAVQKGITALYGLILGV